MGVVFGVCASACVALYSIYTKKVLPVVDQNIWKLALYNNVNACVLFVPLMLVFGEVAEVIAFEKLFDLYFCLYPYLVSYSSSVLPRVCDCPYACSESTYDYSISSTELANEYVVTQAQINDWQYQNKTSIQQNYVSVQIFFRSLTETIVAEIPEVTLVDMFGSIGGQLGLCVGASLITFAEFLEFTGVTLVKFCRRRRQRHADVIKVKPASDVIVQDA